MWFGKNELIRLYLNKAKISSIGGCGPPLNTPMEWEGALPSPQNFFFDFSCENDAFWCVLHTISCYLEVQAYKNNERQK